MNPKVIPVQNSSERAQSNKLSEKSLLPPPSPHAPPPHRNGLQRFFHWVDKKFSHVANLETPVADTADFPIVGKWTTFLANIAFLGFVFGILFWYNYSQSRTNTYITLDKHAGVCKEDPTLSTCCEVPLAVTGTYLADYNGTWNTQKYFRFVTQAYAVNLVGLEYTNAQWSEIMKNIASNLLHVGSKIGKFRDLSWNLIAWACYTAVSINSGYLQFYLSGDVEVIYNKPIAFMGYASNSSACEQSSFASFVPSSHVLSVTTDLQTSDSNCGTDHYGNDYCNNPCPGVLSPLAMGYSRQSTDFVWTVDMASVSVAIAVNYGILKLEHLQTFPADTSRYKLLQSMGVSPTSFVGRNINSYFEQLYSPMDPIYCITYGHDANKNALATCLVRVGDMLMLPFINSYGWAEKPYYLPNICTQGDLKGDNIYANYYCNLMDVVVSFIYYPLNEPSGQVSGDSYYNFYYYGSSSSSTGATGATSSGAFVPFPNEEEAQEAKAPTESEYDPTTDRRVIPKGKRNSKKKAQHADHKAKATAKKAKKHESKYQKPKPGQERKEIAADTKAEDIDAEYYYFNGSYSFSFGSYYSYTPHDDYVPEHGYVDNGNIFTLARLAAMKRNSTLNGDIWVSTNAYNASILALYSYYPSFAAEDFSKICSEETTGAPGGCAIFSVLFEGSTDMTLGIYDFKPNASLAFTNTLFNKVAMEHLVENPPTLLTQTYYSCVDSVTKAIYTAAGLSVANTSAFAPILFLGYVFLVVFYYNNVMKADIPFKSHKVRQTETEKEEAAELILALINDIKANNVPAGPQVLQVIEKIDERKEHDRLKKLQKRTFLQQAKDAFQGQPHHEAVNTKEVAPGNAHEDRHTV